MTLTCHIDVLRKAVNNKLPESLNAASGVDLAIVKELINSGYLTAIDISLLSGPGFLEPRITMRGREYLEANELKVRENTWLRKSSIWVLNNIWKILIPVISGLIILYLT